MIVTLQISAHNIHCND